jgi:hypothetical protein
MARAVSEEEEDALESREPVSSIVLETGRGRGRGGERKRESLMKMDT